MAFALGYSEGAIVWAPSDVGIHDVSWARYQSTVRVIPSRSGTCARKPKNSDALDGSSERRGWPFGIDVSHSISPVNPTASVTTKGHFAR